MLESAKILVHAFDSSRVDGCNAVLAGSPKATTDCLQRVLHAATRVVSGTHKFDRGLTHLLYSDRHWLYVPQRIQLKLGGLFIDVCTATLLSTSSTAASLRPRLTVTRSSALQVDISSSCHVTVAPAVDGLCYRFDGLELAARQST